MARTRLQSIEKQLAATERQTGELRRERRALMSELGVIPSAPLSHLRDFLLRIEGWLAEWEQ